MADLETVEKLKAAGNVAFQKRQLTDALQRYTEAVEQLDHCRAVSEKAADCPPDEKKLLIAVLANRALTHLQLRAFDAAVGDSRRCLELDPRHSKAHYRLGAALRGLGDVVAASLSFQRAIQLTPQSLEAWRELRACHPSSAADGGDEMTKAPPMPSSCVLQHNLAMGLRGGGLDVIFNVIMQLDSQLAGATEHRMIMNILARHYRRLICDRDRTEAFCRAAEAAATRDGVGTVLFLGAGSILPALRAARAAQKCSRVVIVEFSPTLRRFAQALACANGLQEQLQVQPTSGGNLPTAPEAYFGLRDNGNAAGSDTFVVVCESVSDALTSEHLCSMMRAAHVALGSHISEFVPSGASFIAVPVGIHTQDVEGLDLSAFNALRRTYPKSNDENCTGWMSVRLDRQPHTLVEVLAQPMKIWDLAFASGTSWAGDPPSRKEFDWQITKSGRCTAVACWFALRVGDLTMSSTPQCAGGKATEYRHGFKQAVQYLGEEWPVDEGTMLRFAAHFLDKVQSVRFELLEVEAAPLQMRPVPEPLATMLTKMTPGATLPVQSYHFTMIADSARNHAYRDAIEHAVAHLQEKLGRTPRVLDIGTGTGLLAMIAARAGADVWAVEMNPLLRAVASECICRNSDLCKGRLELLPPMLSTQLVIGRELPHKVDLVLSEVLDADLIAEGVLVSLRHATEELLTPEGLLIPSGAGMFVAPVECTPVENATDEWDLEPLGKECSVGYQPFRYESMPHRFLGPAVLALEFDFHRIPQPKVGAPVLVTSQQLAAKLHELKCDDAGKLNGLAWWFDVYLTVVDGKTLTLPAGPGSKQRTWKQNCRFLPQPFRVQKGDVIEVVCAHDESTMLFELHEDLKQQRSATHRR